MIGFRWLASLLSAAPMPVSVELEKVERQRRAASRFSSKVHGAAQPRALEIIDASRPAKPLDAFDSVFKPKDPRWCAAST